MTSPENSYKSIYSSNSSYKSLIDDLESSSSQEVLNNSQNSLESPQIEPETQPQKRKRLAFIVGNSQYQYLDKLDNQPVLDALLIQQTLESIGFTAYLFTNLSEKELRKELRDFFGNVVGDKTDDLVFFYFNGHGAEQSQNNRQDYYFFGIDAKREQTEDYEIIPGLGLRDGFFYRYFINVCIGIVVIDAGRHIFDPNKLRIGRIRDHGMDSSIMTKQVCQQLNSNNLLLDIMSTEKINYTEVDIIYACEQGKSCIINHDSENGYLARALHNVLSKPGSWQDAVQEATAQVVQESNGMQKPSAEMGIIHKLEIIKTVVDSTEVPNTLRLKILKGELENENFELVQEEDDILINLRNNSDEVTIKGLTLKQKNCQGCRYLVIRLRRQQKISFIDCNFLGIGLRIETTSELNPSGIVNVKNFSLQSEFGFNFENIDSISMENIFVQNCVKSAFRLKNIHQVVMKSVHVFNCRVGIDGNDASTVDFDNIIIEKCIFGFGLQNCNGKITASKFKECDVEIYKVVCKIQQSLQQNFQNML